MNFMGGQVCRIINESAGLIQERKYRGFFNNIMG
jgi:hypothetical protein